MIYLIRHGQASFLQENYDQLSDLGIEQSSLLGKVLQGRNFDPAMAASGYMSRHLETASHCLRELSAATDPKKSEAWNEYDHRELISKHRPEFESFDALATFISSQSNATVVLQELLNQSIRDWMEDKHHYSVSFREFKQAAWEALVALGSSLDKGEQGIVFTSGGPITILLMQLLGLEDEQFPELQNRLVNTSITKVLVGSKRMSLSTYNDYSHLEHDRNLITYR